MRRVLAALLLAPLIAVLPFGFGAVLIYPFMLMVILVMAVPLFYVFLKLGWLQCWHAAAAGFLCGIAGT
jgi:hypothetical protein